MMKVLQHPHAVLRKIAEEVHDFNDVLLALCESMRHLMQEGTGGVGIAAPQLGVSKRVVVVDCSLGKHPCKNHGCLTMVNPLILEQSGKLLGREGCLSVPDWVATVPRSKKITVQYQNECGEPQVLKTSAFEARVIQHEVDHLDGVLFIDRVLSTHDLVRRM
ncbi:MAG: peptide deformylase [Mariprofundaceae bacterium]|nr:peptide deformylase [Mariprofundaceae bacterium]